MSMPRKSTMTASAPLAAICLALAGTMYWQVTGRDDPHKVTLPSMPAPVQDDVIPDDAELPVPPREQFAEVVSRPLFSPTRRPPEQEVQAAESPPTQPLDIDLLGVVIWRSQRMALVRPRNDANAMQVAEGGTVSGWTVVVIEPSGVTFRQGESQLEMRLSYKTGEPAAGK